MVHATVPLPGWGLLELAAAGEVPQGREQLIIRGARKEYVKLKLKRQCTLVNISSYTLHYAGMIKFIWE